MYPKFFKSAKIFKVGNDLKTLQLIQKLVFPFFAQKKSEKPQIIYKIVKKFRMFNFLQKVAKYLKNKQT